MENFYLKINNVNDKTRNDMRRSTASYKSQLMTTEQVNKMQSLDEEVSDDEDDSDEDEQVRSDGCCTIL